MTESICPLCKQPRGKGESGSITQWVSVCRCDLENLDQQQLSIQICRHCGKRINKGRTGSITQFIFRYDICSCDAPLKLKNPAQEVAIEKTDPLLAIEEEEGLELEPDTFPVDRYKPLSILGSGATGTVYLASDLLLNKKVAVKILRSFSDRDIVSFQEEAKAMSKLEHSGIVQLLDFGLTESDSPYMVLEFVNGMTLHELLNESGALPWKDAVQIFSSISEALEYAHSNGILHRDIQPGNILITEENDSSIKPKLIDFGLAKVFQDSLESSDDSDSQSATLAGTPLYMSPDQSLYRQYDKRSEIYSLACVLFECLTASAPFAAASPLALLQMHAEKTPPKVIEKLMLPPEAGEEFEIPDELERIISKCLQKDPKNRYQSMKELGCALKSLTGESDLGIENQAPGDEAPAVTETPIEKSAMTWVKTIAGITTMLLLAGAVVFYFSEQTKTKRLEAPKVSEEAHFRFTKLGFHDVESHKNFVKLFSPDARNLELRLVLGDPAFVYLKNCHKLISLDMSTNVITDLATSYIKSPYLKKLLLQSTSVKTLEHVSKLTSLEQLNISNTLVDNQSIKKLIPVKHLQVLNINNCDVDDSIVPILKKFPCLVSFSARSTNMTEKAKDELRKAIPALSIELRPPVVQDNLNLLIQYRKVKEWNKAAAVVKNSLKLIQDAQGKDTVAQVNFLTQLGDVYFGMGNFEEAMKVNDRSVALAESYGSTYLLNIALSTRMAYLFQKQHWHETIATADRLIKNATERDGLSPELLKIYFFKADCWHQMKNYDESEIYFRKVLAIREQLIKEKVELNDLSDIVHPAVAATSLGNIQNNRKNFDEGEKFYLEAINIWNDASKKTKMKYASNISYAFEQLAFISYKRDDFPKAIQYQSQSLNILKKFSDQNTDRVMKQLEKYKSLAKKQLNKH